MNMQEKITLLLETTITHTGTVWNVESTTDETCKCCKSWLAHWQNATESKTVVCSVSGCNCNNELEIVGAHVVKSPEDRKDIKGCFIIPLCKEHNHFSNDGSIKIHKHTKLIVTKKLPTCEK